MSSASTSGRGRSQPSAHSGEVRRGIRILIVDDEPEVLDMLMAYFLASRHEVETAMTGTDALIIVSQQRPDVVLLDVKMPGMNGIEALKGIMKLDPSIPVIIVTGTAELPVTVDAIRHGAFGYVPKPFDLRYLDHLIAASLGR
ncbi:MAG: response regulator [Candidatus Rokuibacteriota bacterium]|nr:MAG: response regulator [Candidatus Rokubacteria bacterium]